MFHVLFTYGDKSTVNINQQQDKDSPERKLTENDLTDLADSMNKTAGKLLEKIIYVLGPDDFKTYHGHAPEAPFLVVDPRILKGAVTEESA